MSKKALCGGRAHETDGWIPIDEVAQQFKDLPMEAFCREFLGTTSNRVGAVYSTESIDEATVDGIYLSKDRSPTHQRLVQLTLGNHLDAEQTGQVVVIGVLLEVLEAEGQRFASGARGQQRSHRHGSNARPVGHLFGHLAKHV